MEPVCEAGAVNDKKSGFISIRCCHNNRFWRREEGRSPWIVAAEESPNSDQSSPSCTLFEFYYDTTDTTLSLRMVQCNKYAIDWSFGRNMNRFLYAGDNPDFLGRHSGPNLGRQDSTAKFVVHDMDSMVRLPKHVVFKGDNGKYLGYASVNGRSRLVFNESDVHSECVRHEVHCTADGNVTLTCLKLSGSWNMDPGMNYLTVESGSSRNPAVFQPVKVDKHTVALRSLDNSLFCKKLTTPGLTDDNCFVACGETIDSAARLVVGESVISRRIYSIDYDLDGAFIYDVHPLLLATVTATNTNTGTSSLTVPISYTESSTQSWSNGFSFTGGAEMEISGGVPFICDSKIKVKAEAMFKHEWGKELEQQKTTGASYTATVDSGKTLLVKVIATKGKCDVKFSYIQKDILTNGDAIRTRMNDGVFRGMNYFDFKFESTIE